MRRKNLKWVALAVGLYLFVLWSAFHWSASQPPSGGSLFEIIERREVAKYRERQAKEAADHAQAVAIAAREARLKVARQAYVAARYDQSHVVFIVVNDAASRFSTGPIRFLTENPVRIPASSQPTAPLAGLQELWEPAPQSFQYLPALMQQTHPGDQWILSAGPTSTLTANIERTIIAPSGCSLSLGFLASIPPDERAAFAAVPRDYFAVRRTPVEPADLPVAAPASELSNWKISAKQKAQIAQQLNDRMKQELAHMDLTLASTAASQSAGDAPVGSAELRSKQWLRADDRLTRGQGVLDYDLRALRVTPDGAPRLFVRARWKLAGVPAFLMTAWFKEEKTKEEKTREGTPREETPGQDPPKPGTAQLRATKAKASLEDLTQEDSTPEAATKEESKQAAGAESPSSTSPTLLFADASWSLAMREGEAPSSLGDRLDFQTVLNEFDADHDGWAELLIHSRDARSNQADATTIALYLYTDSGLVSTKTLLHHHSAASPDDCLDP